MGRLGTSSTAVANILPGLHLAVQRDVTERKRAEQQLREYADSLELLSRRMVDVQEEERRRLARELHDEVGQLLTSLKFALEAAGQGPSGNGGKLAEARRLVDDAVSRVRDLSFDLRPALLDHLGLVPALRSMIERYTAGTGVRVDFQHAGPEHRLSGDAETAAYRIVQEALTDVARHAGVKEAAVRLWLEGDLLQLQVEDQGDGFDPEATLLAGRSSGLLGMRERLALLGGELRIDSAPGGGTHLAAEIPTTGQSRSRIDEHFRRLRR